MPLRLAIYSIFKWVKWTIRNLFTLSDTCTKIIMIIGTGRHAYTYISSIIPILNDLNIQNCIQMNQCISVMHIYTYTIYVGSSCIMSYLKIRLEIVAARKKKQIVWDTYLIKKIYKHNFDLRHIAESTKIFQWCRCCRRYIFWSLKHNTHSTHLHFATRAPCSRMQITSLLLRDYYYFVVFIITEPRAHHTCVDAVTQMRTSKPIRWF